MIHDIHTTYGSWKVKMLWGKYSNGRPRLQLLDAKDGYPVMVPTVNVPEARLDTNEVVIKNWSENEGILESLQDLGIIGPVKRSVQCGFCEGHIVDVLKRF